MDTELLLRPDGFEWSLEVGPAQSVRYTAAVTTEQWDEVGEISNDGGPWSTIMTMSLHRQRRGHLGGLSRRDGRVQCRRRRWWP
ncbi:MAG: hypothetical protein ABI251_05645, partial [Mycobacteriaceae bacterium]